jgi:hypothetical protein
MRVCSRRRRLINQPREGHYRLLGRPMWAAFFLVLTVFSPWPWKASSLAASRPGTMRALIRTSSLLGGDRRRSFSLHSSRMPAYTFRTAETNLRGSGDRKSSTPISMDKTAPLPHGPEQTGQAIGPRLPEAGHRAEFRDLDLKRRRLHRAVKACRPRGRLQISRGTSFVVPQPPSLSAWLASRRRVAKLGA